MGPNLYRNNGTKSAMHRSVEGNSAALAGVTGEVNGTVGEETIAAISTPAGEGAISVVRISGDEAIAIADRIFHGNEKPSRFPSHVQRLGEVRDSDRAIDQVM